MPQLVYLQMGASGMHQFRIAAASVREVEPDVDLVLYSDQPADSIGVEGVELRTWDLGELPEESVANTPEFGRICLHKNKVMQDALAREVDFIVYSDVDIIACAPFLKACTSAAALRPVHVSTEGDARIPEVVCAGFMIARKCEETDRFLKAWEAHTERVIAQDPTRNDEDALNEMLSRSDDWRPHVERLSVNFAAPGWYYDALVPLNALTIRPLFFHANWTYGHRIKEQKLKSAFTVVHRSPSKPLLTFVIRTMRTMLRHWGRSMARHY
jgi:hypothetical protein